MSGRATQWQVRISVRAQRDLEKLGTRDQRRVFKFLFQRLAKHENPKALGKPLKGELADYWRYRVGPIRILTIHEDRELYVIVVEVGHRKEIYR